MKYEIESSIYFNDFYSQQVQKWNDVKESWCQDNSIENQKRLYKVVYGNFEISEMKNWDMEILSKWLRNNKLQIFEDTAKVNSPRKAGCPSKNTFRKFIKIKKNYITKALFIDGVKAHGWHIVKQNGILYRR